MNSSQAALALAQKIGDASQEAAIKNSLTDLYAAKGKVEKAPNRKLATKALAELAKALESKDDEKFDDAAKYLDGFYNALKQHGHMIADEKPQISGCTSKGLAVTLLYYGFIMGGLNYGPRYRVNKAPWKRFN